jgi:chromosome segregation protein
MEQERLRTSSAEREVIERELDGLEERIRSTGDDLTLLDRQLELESTERDRLRRRMTETRQEQKRLEKLLQEALATREAFAAESGAAEESVASTHIELEAAEHELAETPEETVVPATDDLMEDLPGLHQQIEEIVRERERARLEQEQIEAALERLTQEALLDLGAHPNSLTAPDTDREFTDVEIRRLRIRSEQAEDIDPGVTQEYEASVTRRDTMLAQIEDLETAMAEIEEMLRDADREVRRRFRMAFSRVNDLFSLYFREIFGGGNAELMLESADDVESVEIVTQLPGKRARELSGLSGGERTLVAGAFLFSLISASPPPFCILDEVDAALDETNVDRYVGVLKDLSRQTQFIVVTHNRGTMAAANSLYGIVLDEEAGSRALSLRLDEAVVEAGA